MPRRGTKKPSEHSNSSCSTPQELELPCAGCGNLGGRTLYSAPDFDASDREFDLYECSCCHLVRTRPEPSAEILEAAYAPDYYGDATRKFVGLVELWTRFAARRRARHLIAAGKFPSGRLRVLDFGCGRGVLLEAFRALGHEALGVERSGSPFCNLPHIRCGNLAQLGLPGESFDLIVLWHVLEHLDDPTATLRDLHPLLKGKGRLVISVPDFGGPQSRLFGRNWFHLDLPRHLFHFDDRSLSGMLARTGFAQFWKSGPSPDQNAFGFVQSALNAVPGCGYNEFYKLLQAPRSSINVLKLLAYLLPAIVLAVPAAIELALAGLRRQGATLTLTATKSVE